MALLRLLCFTPTTHLSTKHQFHGTPHSSLRDSHHQSNYSVINFFLCQPPSFQFLSLRLARTPNVRTRKNSNFALNFASSFQEQALYSFPANASVESQETEPGTEDFSWTRLIAQNVPWTSTPEDIRSLFERHGKVLDVELSMYNKTRNRGFPFVEMGSPEEASEALNNLESYEYEDRMLKLSYARLKKKTPPPVRPKLSGSGNVVSAEVIFHDNPRKSSGYGFVFFKSKKEAEAALSEFQGKEFMGRPIRVARSRQFVKQPKEESTVSEDTSLELNLSGMEADNAD